MNATDLTDEQLLSAITADKPATPRSTVPALVRALKQADQDHEFYPTTDAIIAAMVRSIGQFKDRNGRWNRTKYRSVLDIGAGNGKVLLALRDRSGFDALHAIEKSSMLCRELDPEIMVVGTAFEEQSLLSKATDVIFSNPPYSIYEQWTEKIIRESACKVIFLVIPQRWENSVIIKDALKFRGVTARKVGDFDFEDAEDRTARAKVHLLRIDMAIGRNFGCRDEIRDDAFEKFFEEQFAPLINKFKEEAPTKCPKCGSENIKADEEGKPKCDDCYNYVQGGRQRPFKSLASGPDYPDRLVSLYREETDNVNRNYQLIGQLDASLLREFEIFPKKIMDLLKTRLAGLRNEYWHELFSRLDTITQRLTSGSRKNLLNTLHKHVHVDFTTANIYEVIVWVIKNANRYIDSQLIVTYEHMVDKCNVHLYKSNKKVWVDNRWRYGSPEIQNTHYALDYRIVTHRVGGIGTGSVFSDKGLQDRAADFISDLLTIGRNLGFTPEEGAKRCLGYHERREWTSGTLYEFWGHNSRHKKRELLLDVRAFKNGNLHLRFNKDFILALNVEHGRLKGWINTPKEAAEELNDPKAAQFFQSNLLIGLDNPGLLLTEKAA